MDTTARDRRIRIGAGAVIAALGVLSTIIIFVSARGPKTNVLLIIMVSVQALLALGLGAWLASGKRGTSELVPVPGRWRKVFLLLVILLGAVFFVWQLGDDPSRLLPLAFWPSLVASAILLQFGAGRHHFQNQEQWRSVLSPEETHEALARVFTQPGLAVQTHGTNVWLEISHDWQGRWRHGEAARRLKVRPHIRFVVEAADGGTLITAFSREVQLGMYDVLKLAEEMSDSGVALAKQATSSSRPDGERGDAERKL